MASHTNYSVPSKPEYEMLNEIIIDIKEKLEDDLKTSVHNIYRVPCTLRKLNEEAYTPQLISIGPLHYGRKQLNPLQQQKLHYFSSFWVRVNNEAKMKEYKGYLASKDKDIRNCYAVKFQHYSTEITEKKFVPMMLLDAVFIMELLLRNQAENKSKYEDDSILKQTWLNNSIKRDLLLLENQIPFFILEKLYDEYVPPDPDTNKHPKLLELVAICFDRFFPYKMKSSTRSELLEERKPIHFTDLIRHTYLWDCRKRGPCYSRMTAMKIIKEVGVRPADTCKEGLGCSNDSQKEGLPNLMTATKLKEAGVSFKKVNDKPLVDIKFKKVSFLSWFLCLGCLSKFTYFKNCLQIPELKIDDTTECILRNLIAFEQCHYADKPYICNYVSFIDSLIHTKDDVELLVEKQVIIHELGSYEEISTLVNGLCKQVVTNQTCYRNIIDALDKHYKNPWNHTMAALRLVYFRDAWRASSSLVGIAVLIFTLYSFFKDVL